MLFDLETLNIRINRCHLRALDDLLATRLPDKERAKLQREREIVAAALERMGAVIDTDAHERADLWNTGRGA